MNKYKKMFSSINEEKEADTTFFRLMKIVPEGDKKELFEAWSEASNRIFDSQVKNKNMLY